MPPSPEQTEGQQPATKQAPAERRLAHGLQLKARVTSPLWEVGLSAEVHDFTPGEVILLLEDQLTAGTHVTVQVDTASFTGDILFCEPSGSGWEAHVSFDDVDATGLRRTPRFPVSIPARVFAIEFDSPIEARITDVSGGGLGIELPTPLPKQTNIAVQSPENTALGVVRHCRETPEGLFQAGIQFHHIITRDPDLKKASEGWMGKLGARFGLKKQDRPRGWS